MAKKKELKKEIKATKAKISKQEGKLKKLKKKLKKAEAFWQSLYSLGAANSCLSLLLTPALITVELHSQFKYVVLKR